MFLNEHQYHKKKIKLCKSFTKKINNDVFVPFINKVTVILPYLEGKIFFFSFLKSIDSIFINIQEAQYLLV
jgi:hypothetical protein